MNKKSFLCLLTAIFLITSITGCNAKSELATVKFNEIVHSIFYAPQYAAIEKDFFTDESLDVVLIVDQGADKSMAMLISGDTNITMLGTESGIYVYNEERENFAIPFAQLTQRAGNFLLSRTNDDNFSWNNIYGKKIIGGLKTKVPYEDLVNTTFAKEAVNKIK